MGTVLEVICTCPDECPEESWAFASISLYKCLDLGRLVLRYSVSLGWLPFPTLFTLEQSLCGGPPLSGLTRAFGSSVRTGGEPEVSLLETEAEKCTDLHSRSLLTMLPAGDG